MKLKSEGDCKYCGRKISSTGMSKHLLSCEQRKKTNEKELSSKDRIYLLRASAGPYFTYFEVDSKASLKVIDDFLRQLWLECCGHLSSFIIDGKRYDCSMSKEYPSNGKNMNCLVKDALTIGIEFTHIYDFGTETLLQLKVIAIRAGSNKRVETLARNDPPLFPCACNSPAKDVCSQCVWEGPKGFLCMKCAKKHTCGEEMLLPVVNSPRMGMCGYTG